MAGVPSELPNATDLVDLLLAHLAADGPLSAAVEPAGPGHVVRIDAGEGYAARATIPRALGNAVSARLAVLAEVRLAPVAVSVGRFRVALRSAESGPHPPTSDFVLAVRTSPDGLAAELHRLATTTAPRPALRDERDEGNAAFGRYRLKGEIGRGGMGVVYRGEHVVLQKEVAIKVLHANASAEPSLAAQFVVEARAACRARHPGIVDVTDFGTLEDGRAYLAMELVEGPTLAALLEREGPMPPERVIALSTRIADALHAASARGVVHRDLTPSNIFVCEGDRPKIGDFGVAKLIDAEASSRDALGQGAGVVGTANYMAPEQGRGEAVDGRSDIYSLGCVMYRMLTGKVPFTGGSLIAVVSKHATEPPPPMVSPHGAVPAPLERIVARALAKAPGDRFQSADELRCALADAAEESTAAGALESAP